MGCNCKKKQNVQPAEETVQQEVKVEETKE